LTIAACATVISTPIRATLLAITIRKAFTFDALPVFANLIVVATAADVTTTVVAALLAFTFGHALLARSINANEAAGAHRAEAPTAV